MEIIEVWLFMIYEKVQFITCISIKNNHAQIIVYENNKS